MYIELVGGATFVNVNFLSIEKGLPYWSSG